MSVDSVFSSKLLPKRTAACDAQPLSQIHGNRKIMGEVGCRNASSSRLPFENKSYDYNHKHSRGGVDTPTKTEGGGA